MAKRIDQQRAHEPAVKAATSLLRLRDVVGALQLADGRRGERDADQRE